MSPIQQTTKKPAKNKHEDKKIHLNMLQ